MTLTFYFNKVIAKLPPDANMQLCIPVAEIVNLVRGAVKMFP